MVRLTVFLAALLGGCVSPFDSSTSVASFSLSVAPGQLDSLFVDRLQSGERWKLGPGDSLCITFAVPKRAIEYLVVQSLWQPQRIFVWATPSEPFSHLDIRSLGGATFYSLSDDHCSSA